MDKDELENLKTWEDIGLLITSAKRMMNHWAAGTKTAEQIMKAFGAGKKRPHCESCKHNWACTPFCRYPWHPEEKKCYAMHRGFIPREVYVGRRACPHFEKAE